MHALSCLSPKCFDMMRKDCEPRGTYVMLCAHMFACMHDCQLLAIHISCTPEQQGHL